MDDHKEIWMTISLDVVNCVVTLLSCGESKKECLDHIRSINVDDLEGKEKQIVSEALDSPYINTFKALTAGDGCDPKDDAIAFRDEVSQWLMSCGIVESDAMKIIKGIGSGLRGIIEGE